MEENKEFRPSNGDERDSQKGPSLGFYSLPKVLRSVVADCISDDNKHLMRPVLLDGQHITLCFSQGLNLELGSCWRFGCLSSEDEWESSLKAKVDQTYPIKDYQSCLNFLKRENTAYWSITIDVLVFQLDMSSQDLSGALDDIEDALVHLKEHLSRVQHVVFEIENGAFCCFSFKDAIGNSTGLRQTVDRLPALTQFLVDLRTSWAVNQTLDTKMLLDHFILSDVKPESDMYRSKFVILLSYCCNRELFNAVDPTLKSSKLRWIYDLETFDDLRHFNQKIANRCLAIHLDISKLDGRNDSIRSLPSFFFYEDNPSIERIVIKSRRQGLAIKLPRPSAPLTDSSPRSALIELSLTGDWNIFDLTQLNNSFFPHLAHLSVIGGFIKGRLDSQSVPSLKTLRIEPGEFWVVSKPNVVTLVRERTQAIVDADRPWQLVASQDQKGWSLASYDDPTLNPPDDGKEDSPPSPPLIRELLLVIQDQQHASECQSRLDGKAPLKATAGHRNDNLLVWSPDRVEKIIAFGKPTVNPMLAFKEEILGQTRILTSLTCYSVLVTLHGAALPNLRSLKLNNGSVWMSGAFPQLRMLSFEEDILQSKWEVDAPLLESLSCRHLYPGYNLFVRSELLPHLSYLRIEPWKADPKHCPTIIVDENSLGLSPNTHVVFGKGMTQAANFDQWQLQNVSHLELAVDALQLPVYWENTEWQCEALTINVYVDKPEHLREQGVTVVKMSTPLPKVKKFTVAVKDDVQVLLNSKMPNLTDLTVPSPRSFGLILWCPELKYIRFTGKLSESDKKKCLNRATYLAMGAQLKSIYFDYDDEMTIMSWNDVPGASGESSSTGLLKENDGSSVPPE